jgi:hypothetical protein
MRSIKDVLQTDYGLDLSGWTHMNTLGVSADGTTVTGSGLNPDGSVEAWIAHLGNLPPDAEIIVEQLTDIGADALVRLDGTTSSDRDHNIDDPNFVFSWTIDGNSVCVGDKSTCGTFTSSLAFGPHEVTLQVADPDGASDQKTITVNVDPAELALFEVDHGKVDFNNGNCRVFGTVGLPSGVNYTELAPEVEIAIAIADVEIAPLAGLTLAITEDGSEWSHVDDRLGVAISRLTFDWKGASYSYSDTSYPIRFKSRLITTTDTLLNVKYDMNKIGDVFTVEIDPGDAVVVFDENGGVASSTNATYEVDELGAEVTLSLPFPLLDESTITIAGGAQSDVDRTIPVAEDLRGSVGRYRADCNFDGASFLDGAATTPRNLLVELEIGDVGFPGDASLGPLKLVVKSASGKWVTANGN